MNPYVLFIMTDNICPGIKYVIVSFGVMFFGIVLIIASIPAIDHCMQCNPYLDKSGVIIMTICALFAVISFTLRRSSK